MEIESIIKGTNLFKKYKGFELSIDSLEIPKGFATALIGENGAGKTTLINMMMGIKQDYKGDLVYFDEHKKIDESGVKERIGYTSPSNYYLPGWTIEQVEELTKLLFEDFDKKRFHEIADALCIPIKNAKTIKSLSDGNKVKLMLAAVLSRKTDILIMDEPASPLDPLMRDKLCEIIQQYLQDGEGKRSVFFSTHNIADMENITDYAILMDNGRILEQGFVEELKEKYVLVKGDKEDYDTCSKLLIGESKSNFGFEGLCESSKLDQLAGVSIVCETPNLSQICVGIMKEHSKLKHI